MTSTLLSGATAASAGQPPWREVLQSLWNYGEKSRENFGHISSSEKTQFECRVSSFEEGMRLDRFLRIRFKYFKREQWRAIVRDRGIRINGVPQKPTFRVHGGDLITFQGAGFDEPAIPLDLKILYEDDDVVAILKPAHLPVHHGGKYLKNTLVQLIKHRQESMGLKGEIRFLHRLDMDTSGVILATKREDLHRELCDQFENDQIQKIYLALVFGSPSAQEWTQDAPIGPCVGSRIRIKLWKNPQGLESRTDFSLRSTAHDGRFSLIEARPKTGRTNQIRVHSAVSGLPLVGDKTFFPNEDIFIRFQEGGYDSTIHERVLFHRTLLHARQLTFFHPRLNRQVTVSAPLPDDFLFCLKALNVPVV